jgi:pre-rRNA-processing protein TSR1
MVSDESEDEDSIEDDQSIGENDRIKFDMQPIDEDMSVIGEPTPSNVSTIQDTISMAGIEDVINEVEVQKFREEVENLKWADQIDIPIGQSARERFQRYRGMKSFRFVVKNWCLLLYLELLIGIQRRICR